MINRLFTVVQFSAFFVLTGCSGFSANGGRVSLENQPGYFPAVGSMIHIRQPLNVAAGHAGFYLQNGVNLGGKHDRLAPFCYLRFYNVSTQPRTIRPDSFEIRDSGIETRLVATSGSFRGYQNVSLQLVDATPSDILEVVTMRIHSDRQPDLYLLECGGAEAHPANVEPPTIAEMRTALGKKIELETR